jgi:ubiquinone/menaquinone biosynthesis C-methylase UbiE
MQPDQAVINRWSGAAPFWEKHRELIREMFEPVTQALVQDAHIGRGHAVLDIATGPGEPALTVAGIVGPEGKVVGIDPIPGMVAAARRETERRGLTNTQFDVGSADELPFAADTFDAVLSRFGVMFFPSPEDSIRGMLRVLKPGGRMALAVWGPLEHNPFYFVTSRVIESYLGPTVPPPGPAEQFRFAESGKLRNMLADAGALAASERPLRFATEAPMSPEEFWGFRFEMSEKLRESVASLSADELNEVKDRVIEGLGEYSTGRGLSFATEVLIVSGMKRDAA